MKHLINRLVCLIRGHKWNTVDLIKDPNESEPLWIQFNCRRCGDFKVGIYTKDLVERMTQKKNYKRRNVIKKANKWLVRLFKDRQKTTNPCNTFRIGKAQLEIDSIKLRRALNNGTSCR